MAKNFTNQPMAWVNGGTAPSDELIANGFQAGYKPPADVFNHQWKNTHDCIKELQETISPLINEEGKIVSDKLTSFTKVFTGLLGAGVQTEKHIVTKSVSDGCIPVARSIVYGDLTTPANIQIAIIDYGTHVELIVSRVAGVAVSTALNYAIKFNIIGN